MSDLLGIGASGVSAYRAALAAIGDNVANAQTKGYARRTVGIAEQPTGGAMAVGYSSGKTFGGASAVSVGRAWDDYQAGTARTAMSTAGRAEVRGRWSSATETAIGDANDATSVGVKLTAVYSAAATLAGNPSDGGRRGAFLSALDDAAGAFRTTAAALRTVSDGIGAEAQTAVQSFNAGLDQLDQVNAALVRAQPGSSEAASLMDRRDQIIDGLSGSAAVAVSIDSATGAATVTLANDSAVRLTGAGGARLAVEASADGQLALTAIARGASSTVAASGGALQGLVESAAAVADRRSQLDAIATSFAASINGWSAGGQDANGAPGAALLSGSGAAGLALATGDPAKVPAAAGGAANGNLLALAAVRTADGSEDRWAGLVTDQARLTAAANAESTSAGALRDSALATRDAATGVDLDTEAANLLRYQQAYSGAAKIIQVARETLQAILDIV